MEGMTLIAEARRVGLTVLAEGDCLVVRGPRSAEALARRLLDKKTDVMAALRQAACESHCDATTRAAGTAGSVGVGDNATTMTTGEAVVLVPDHPLAGFDWDASSGYCPGRRIVRHGIEHKVESCSSCRSWLHVWGGQYCLDCWPPTDPLAVADKIAGESR